MSEQLLPKFYTTEELASLLSVQPEHVTALVHTGTLRAYRIANQVRISEADLQQYLDTCRITAPQTNGTTNSTPDRTTCPTLGGQTTFTYTGSVNTGTTIHPGTKATYKLHFTASQWQELLKTFRGKSVRAGTNFAKPEPGSLGAWIKQHWNTKMGPAVYVGGILIREGYATREKPGWITIHNQASTRS
jgi:excisionase family DNA binding protein